MDLLGQQCLARKDYAQALWFFEKKLQLDPGNAQVLELVRSIKVKIDPNSVPREEAQEELLKRALNEESYYNVLGIDEKATEADITKKFRKIALLLHPDKNPDPKANKAFSNAKRAFEVLSCAETRAVYDAQGEAGLRRREESVVMEEEDHLNVSVRSTSMKGSPSFRRSNKGRLRRLSIVYPGEGSAQNCAAADPLLDPLMSPLGSSWGPQSPLSESVKFESDSSAQVQLQQFEKQQKQRLRRASAFRAQRDESKSAKRMYEPPRELCRQWQRVQVVQEARLQHAEAIARNRTNDLAQQYEAVMQRLSKQRAQCKLLPTG